MNIHLLYNSSKYGNNYTIEFTINIGKLYNITLQILQALLTAILADTCYDYSAPYAAIMEVL